MRVLAIFLSINHNKTLHPRFGHAGEVDPSVEKINLHQVGLNWTKIVITSCGFYGIIH